MFVELRAAEGERAEGLRAVEIECAEGSFADNGCVVRWMHGKLRAPVGERALDLKDMQVSLRRQLHDDYFA